MVSRRAASEFPNDNPELHDGLIWASESLCGSPLPTLRLRPPVGRLPKVLGPSWESEATQAPHEPAANDPAPDGALEEPTAIEPASDGAFDEPTAIEQDFEEPTRTSLVLVAALVRVALERGATRAAAELPDLLSGERYRPDLAGLLAAGATWRAVLDGTSDDLAACGDQPLDAWGAELLATLLGAPAEREALRRALRRHGVAAFGVLRAA